MDEEAYEKVLRELKEQEYNEVYKVNLCFVCSKTRLNALVLNVISLLVL